MRVERAISLLMARGTLERRNRAATPTTNVHDVMEDATFSSEPAQAGFVARRPSRRDFSRLPHRGERPRPVLLHAASANSCVRNASRLTDTRANPPAQILVAWE